MQFGETWCSLVQIGAVWWCNLVKFWGILVQLGVICCNLMQIGVTCCNFGAT